MELQEEEGQKQHDHPGGERRQGLPLDTQANIGNSAQSDERGEKRINNQALIGLDRARDARGWGRQLVIEIPIERRVRRGPSHGDRSSRGDSSAWVSPASSPSIYLIRFRRQVRTTTVFNRA